MFITINFHRYSSPTKIYYRYTTKAICLIPVYLHCRPRSRSGHEKHVSQAVFERVPYLQRAVGSSYWRRATVSARSWKCSYADAVSVVREGSIIGHLPRRISRISTLFIGASLSEPHTSVTSLHTHVCIYAWTDHLLETLNKRV